MLASCLEIGTKPISSIITRSEAMIRFKAVTVASKVKYLTVMSDSIQYSGGDNRVYCSGQN